MKICPFVTGICLMSDCTFWTDRGQCLFRVIERQLEMLNNKK